MIKLDIREYCQECPEFIPEVLSRPELATVETHQFDSTGIDTIKLIVSMVGDTVVGCQNRAKCNAIYKYMKRED